MLPLILCAAAACGLLLYLLRVVPRGWAAWPTGILGAVFLLLSVVWLTSNQFTGAGFNDAVLYHLRVGFEGAGFLEYLGAMLFTGLAFVASALVGLWLVRAIRKRADRSDANPGAALSIVALTVLCLLHPTINGFLATRNQAIYGEDSLIARVLSGSDREAGVKYFEDYYVEPRLNIPAKPRKNLVLLYAESMEQTYFDESIFPGLITQLKKLEPEALRFASVEQLPGTGFTLGGIVASQCGIPLVTAGHQNSMRGMDRFLSGATCLGDLLQDQGYAAHYLGGARLSFAGKGKFFHTHGFESVQGVDELRPLLEDPDYEHTWGLYDDFLLERFFERFSGLSQGQEPFALVGLTLDTHHPHGHLSRSCEGQPYGDGSNLMLNAVKCADSLLANVIRRIRSSPWADNTLLVVASDHLALVNDATDQLKSGNRQNLLWIFDGAEAQGRLVTEPISTVDTAAILAHFLGGEEAFGLGRNIFTGGESLVTALPRVRWQVREWRESLGGFWDLPELIASIKVDPDGPYALIGGRRFEAPLLAYLDEGALHSIRFEFDSKRMLHSYLVDVPAEQPMLWIDNCARVRTLSLRLPVDGLCAYLGKMGSPKGLAVRLREQLSIPRSQLVAMQSQAVDDSVAQDRSKRVATMVEYGVSDLQSHALPIPAVDSDATLEIWSSGGPINRSEYSSSDETHRFRRGLSLLRLDHDGVMSLVARYDLCRKEEAPSSSIAELIAAESEHSAVGYLLAIHDTATCGKPLAPVFEGLPLQRWQEIDFREPYVAFLGAGENAKLSAEFTGKRHSSLHIALQPQSWEQGVSNSQHAAVP